MALITFLYPNMEDQTKPSNTADITMYALNTAPIVKISQ